MKRRSGYLVREKITATHWGYFLAGEKGYPSRPSVIFRALWDAIY